MNDQELQESYRYCAAVARTRARNFYYGFLVLPPEKRRSMHAIYAFMRCCDDIADDAPAAERGGRLQALRAALDGDCAGSPAFPAFHDAVARHAIPREYFHALIDGAEQDQEVARYPTFDALYQYCYRVAGVVGLVCLHVFGFRKEVAKRHAEHCGIAFQLTNILRDLREDAEAGRIYLPQEDLARFGCTEEQLLAGTCDDRFRALMAFEAKRARGYYRDADALVPLVSPDSRACLAAMMGIYEGVLDHVVASGYDVFPRRARLSAWQKGAVLGRAWWRHRGGRGEPPLPAGGGVGGGARQHPDGGASP